jgi:hypothetical protein
VIAFQKRHLGDEFERQFLTESSVWAKGREKKGSIVTMSEKNGRFAREIRTRISGWRRHSGGRQIGVQRLARMSTIAAGARESIEDAD